MQQYWDGRTQYEFWPVMKFADAFATDTLGRTLVAELDKPHHTGPKEAGLDPLVRDRYAEMILYSSKHHCRYGILLEYTMKDSDSLIQYIIALRPLLGIELNDSMKHPP